MPVRPGVIAHLNDLGFGHVARVNSREPLAFVVHSKRDLERFFVPFFEKLRQHFDHELHRGVIVVVDEHRIFGWLFELRLGNFNSNVATTFLFSHDLLSYYHTPASRSTSRQ